MSRDAARNDATPLEPVFGRLLTAMVTPFDDGGDINHAEAARLATHLVDELGHDGLVINGTTGESPTTTDAEKRALVATVARAVGDRAHVVAGVGTFSTVHTTQLARQAEDAGADGLLVVTPYYSRPPADALEEHFVDVADSTALPCMLYDIPHRAGIAIPEAVLVSLGQHARIVAVKDAKSDVVSSSAVIAATGMHYYAGDDGYLLPLLAVGGVGVVGTSTHFSGLQAKAIIEAHLAGDPRRATALHAQALGVFRGVFATQGCMMVKAALQARGWAMGPCRKPMGVVAPDVLDRFLRILDELGSGNNL
ncbi:4-hydroxy-tetrahydrodipicolinate synthase [Tessaracoccus antarcticus]|uniref:4-hydroxy-tetrahydrodipicolinate synthase n=1 Tax=Tessaracoccus antarcticus TaxID=2479848 RepID=A0A3M0G7R5_9ACTN|nr:4-hydroxy-tetrahydrodipicolinate synthase [Tessaracoccus antarcticus]RMB58432.1 4-hydroxy-tetrahydrodipicolinate synthase [Tessaracoccus antarcticus]